MVRKAQRGTLLRMSFARLDDRYDQLQREEDKIHYLMPKAGKNTKAQKHLKRRLKLIQGEQKKTRWAMRKKRSR